MSKTVSDIARDINDRLVKCGGCGRTFHLRQSWTGPVAAARCFNCCEALAKASETDVMVIRDAMEEHMHEPLPFGWVASRWAHPRTV